MAGVKKFEATCGEDVKKYCDTVTRNEGGHYFCLRAHEDKVGSKCDLGLYEVPRNLERDFDRAAEAADACWSDIEQFCAHAEARGGGLEQCLVATLKPGCRAAVSKLPTSK